MIGSILEFIYNDTRLKFLTLKNVCHCPLTPWTIQGHNEQEWIRKMPFIDFQ